MTTSLRPMTQAEFDDWKPGSVKDYACGHIAAGSMPASEALDRAEQLYDELLGDGLATAGQHLFRVEVDGRPGGVLWLGDRDQDGVRRMFVFDLVIAEPLRGKGIGRQVMRAAEDFARSRGACELRLHVFGSNLAARRLYDHLGYQPTNISMAKDLTAGSGPG